MLGKLVRKLGIFPFLSCSRTHKEPRNFPSLSAETGSALLCSVRRLLLLWGRIAWVLGKKQPLNPFVFP
ncbi:hypothetical protein SLEP1_g10902 [Rubroshorea leprosula]|uniref:Uncharacterized protein n=1 Tax=Rubroshorea leprosula TaxID=152421 RepID=A0AAV5IJ13_9ROSI|nr:hypothetical protein SLEP1_g10902 [Rubroshorea leprosula]